MTNIPVASASSLPSMLTTHRYRSTNNIPKIGNKRQTRFQKPPVDKDGVPLVYPVDNKSLDEHCLSMDTTLTPDQRVYVDMLKKKISGGALSQRVRCKSSSYYHILCYLNSQLAL